MFTMSHKMFTMSSTYINLIITIILWDKFHCYLHFIDEETELRRVTAKSHRGRK